MKLEINYNQKDKMLIVTSKGKPLFGATGEIAKKLYAKLKALAQGK